MKIQPKSRKFLKPHNPKLKFHPFHQKIQTQADCVIALVALTPQCLTYAQIEAARRVIVRTLKKKGKVLIRVSPTHPRTAIPLETRMGSGKGAVDEWVRPIRNGTILFEVSQVDEKTAASALKQAIYKLSGQYRIEVRRKAQEAAPTASITGLSDWDTRKPGRIQDSCDVLLTRKALYAVKKDICI